MVPVPDQKSLKQKSWVFSWTCTFSCTKREIDRNFQHTTVRLKNLFSIGMNSPRRAESNGTTHSPNLKSRSGGGGHKFFFRSSGNFVSLDSSQRAELNGTIRVA